MTTPLCVAPKPFIHDCQQDSTENEIKETDYQCETRIVRESSVEEMKHKHMKTLRMLSPLFFRNSLKSHNFKGS